MGARMIGRSMPRSWVTRVGCMVSPHVDDGAVAGVAAKSSLCAAEPHEPVRLNGSGKRRRAGDPAGHASEPPTRLCRLRAGAESESACCVHDGIAGGAVYSLGRDPVV